MKTKEKLKILQEALQGQHKGLQQLKREQQKKAMPIVRVYGIIDQAHCHPLLFDLEAIDADSLLDGDRTAYEPLGACLDRFKQEDSMLGYRSPRSACTTVEADDPQYDLVPVNYIQIQSPSNRTYYLRNQTVGDLRRLYKQSSEYINDLFIPLFIDSDPAKRYDYFFQKT